MSAATLDAKTLSAEWADWLADYQAVTGRRRMTGSSSARKAFAARRREGITLEQLKLATRGAHDDRFMRENGHDIPDTILRPSKVGRYVALGERLPPPAAEAPAFTEADAAEAELAWQAARTALEPSLPHAAAELYLDPVVPLGIADGTLWLAGPRVELEWVRRRYAAVIVAAVPAIDGLEVTRR